MKRMGYIIGLVVGIPIFIIIVNFLFFRGNNPSEEIVLEYIQKSKIITIILPKNVQMTSEQYTVGISRRGNPSAFVRKYFFYDFKMRKYMFLLIFKGFDGNSQIRPMVLRQNQDGDKISVRINQKQLNNPKYGTKENPVPVFPIDMLDLKWKGRGWESDPFHVSDDLNKIFVEQYLKHFMPKDEYEEMFKK